MNQAMKWSWEVRSARQIAAFLSSLLMVIAVAMAGCGVAAPPAAVAANKGKASTQFDAARTLVHQGKFAEAVAALDAFLAANPNHKFASRAHFLRAKSKMGAHETEAAQIGFADVIKRFPTSDEARKAEFKLAMIEFLNGNVDEATKQFDAIEKAANGPYTPEASVWVKYLSDEAKQ